MKSQNLKNPQAQTNLKSNQTQPSSNKRTNNTIIDKDLQKSYAQEEGYAKML